MKVKVELESLEGAVEVWAGLQESVSRLKGKLGSAVNNDLRPPLDEVPECPALHSAKRKLLEGRELTMAALPIFAQQVSEGPAALELWEDLNKRARGLHLKIVRQLGSQVSYPPRNEAPKQIEPPVADTLERIGTARKDLLQLWYRLWVDATPDFSTANEGLDDIEEQLWVEKGLLPQPEAVKDAVPGRKELGEKVLDLKLLLEAVRPEAPPRGPSAYERLALLLQARSRRAEVLIAVLAFLIAVYTGLKAEYFDQPFGTWRDYADIVVWAVAAGTLSDLLLKALDRLWVLGTAVRSRTAP
jgi:hypothetical protein